MPALIYAMLALLVAQLGLLVHGAYRLGDTARLVESLSARLSQIETEIRNAKHR